MWQRAVSSATAQVMRGAMTEVVTNGTASGLSIDGMDVGAKTGTAQTGSTAPLRSHAWVIAWAGPAGQRPDLAVAVLVEAQPGAANEQTGGRVAAPIARRVIEQAAQPVPEQPKDGG